MEAVSTEAAAPALKGHTVKSNARRAARKAGLDPKTVALSADGLFYVGETPEARAARIAAEAAPAEPPEPGAGEGETAGEGKAQIVLRMLARPQGANIAELAAATGWLPHTTRARLAGLRKAGLRTSHADEDGRGRVHRLAAQILPTPSAEAVA